MIKFVPYASDYFNSKVTITELPNNLQVTIDIIANDEVEFIHLYNKLHNYISDKDEDCAASLQQLPIYKLREFNYRNVDIQDTFNITTIAELAKVLKTVHTIKYSNININIGNGYIKSAVNTDNNKVAALQWIRNNHPHDREITTDYYARYVSGNIAHIQLNQFAKMVRDQGYKTIQYNQKRLWIRDN